MNMSCTQTVSREEYRRLDNRVTCILQQRWPANEISQWVGMLKGQTAGRGLRHPCAVAIHAHRCWPCRPSPPRCRTRFRPVQPPHCASADS